MNLMKLVAVLLIPVVCLTGCATIVGKDVFPVTINSNPDGATITIVDEKGKKMYSGTTPATVSLVAGESYFHAKTYDITFSKAGYKDQYTSVKATLSGWYWGNILFGGLIGLLIVDPISGKMYKLDTDVTVNMNKELALNDNEQALKIVSIDQVPKHLKKHLVQIN